MRLNSWRQVRVSQVAEIFLGGTPKRSVPQYWGGGVKWASAKDVAGCNTRYLRETEETISSVGIQNSAAKVLNKDTVVITARGTVGAICMLGEPMTFNQTCYGLVANDNTDPSYLYYALKATLGQIRALSYGTVFDTITMKTFDVIEIPHPLLPEQRAIAAILGALDDKIELNRQMNQTLEAIAQALFKSWFVDFEPFRAQGMEDSPLGPIPGGWGVVELGTIADVIDCLHSKKPSRQPNGKPLLQLWNIRDDGLIDMTDTFYIDEEDYNLWTSRIEGQEGNCVITNVGRVAATAQIPSGLRAALGRNMTAIRCRRSFTFPTFLIECLKSSSMKTEITMKTDIGTILDAMNVKDIPTLRLVRPPTELVERFEIKARPLRNMMEKNLTENYDLAAIRDTLLPKLLSGEIRVKDAEKFVEEKI